VVEDVAAGVEAYWKFVDRLEAVRQCDYHSDGRLAGFFYFHAGFHTLEDEVAWWGLEGEVGELARELAATQGERVLVHQDLHGDNVLAAEREPWLVIDPKPLAAEREFAVAPIVRSGELGHSRRDVLYRLDRLCSELGLDPERARGWTIVQTVAWADGAVQRLDEVVDWLS